MGAAVSAGADNDELVDNLLKADYIKTNTIERVFRAVDRGHYFTVEYKENAYKDLAWKNGNVHISAPCIYSEVLESLQLGPGMSFLNLGSGTGYLSTMAGLILGTYGTNHGVEIHGDVLNYAKKKLDEFCLTSPAVDEYDFCRPTFIKGNCLHLAPENCQYDRVYCGATCPENHEDYMKNLIKVGGILVMPLNNHLLQIYRISDTSWETKIVLSVAYASLICTNVSNKSEPLEMPVICPPPLQDICRYAVRSILRKKVDEEHPELKIKPPRREVSAREDEEERSIQAIQDCVLPFLGDHSDDDDDDAPSGPRIMIRGFTGPRFLVDAQSVPKCRTLLDLRNLLVSHQREMGSYNEDETETDSQGRTSQSPGQVNITTATAATSATTSAQEEEMSDSGANTSTTDLADDDYEMGDATVSERLTQIRSPPISQGTRPREGKREKFDSGIVEDMESRREDLSDSDNEIDHDPGVAKNSRKSEDLFVKFLDSDTESSASESANCKPNTGKESMEDAKPVEPVKNYSLYMREKIRMLPLPMTLKYFVNLGREL